MALEIGESEGVCFWFMANTAFLKPICELNVSFRFRPNRPKQQQFLIYSWHEAASKRNALPISNWYWNESKSFSFMVTSLLCQPLEIAFTYNSPRFCTLNTMKQDLSWKAKCEFPAVQFSLWRDLRCCLDREEWFFCAERKVSSVSYWSSSGFINLDKGDNLQINLTPFVPKRFHVALYAFPDLIGCAKTRKSSEIIPEWIQKTRSCVLSEQDPLRMLLRDCLTNKMLEHILSDDGKCTLPDTNPRSATSPLTSKPRVSFSIIRSFLCKSFFRYFLRYRNQIQTAGMAKPSRIRHQCLVPLPPVVRGFHAIFHGGERVVVPA